MPGDLEMWARVSQYDMSLGSSDAHKRRVDQTELVIVRWTRGRKGYVGVSWGEDSVCQASMCVQLIPEWPLIWVRSHPRENPDCFACRDAFLEQHPEVRDDEVIVNLLRDDVGGYSNLGPDSKEQITGFREAGKRHGKCYVSGVRAQE